MYTKEELLELGYKYYYDTGQIPAAKKFTKKAGYCSRDWIYREFGSWGNFLKKLEFTQHNGQLLSDIVGSIKKLKKEILELNIKIQSLKINTELSSTFLFKEDTLRYWIKKYCNEEIDWSKIPGVDKYQYISIVSKGKGNVWRELKTSKEEQTRFNDAAHFKKGLNNTHCSRILNFYNKKHCSSCKRVKTKIEFFKNKTKSGGLSSWCKNCSSDYMKENPGIWRQKAAERKAEILKRTPKWGQEGIREFYKNCPNDRHVDHVIPLRGKSVSGLHVLNNLQYLLAADNIRKNNKFFT